MTKTADLQIQVDKLRKQNDDNSSATRKQFEEHTATLNHVQKILQGLLDRRNQPPVNPNTTSGESSSPPIPPVESPQTNLGSLAPNHPRTESNRTPFLPGGLAPRLSKVEFPKFSGPLLREWICKCEQFFLLDSTPPEIKVRLASLHLEGQALQWHHTFMSNRFDQYPSWPEYIIEISTRFGKLFDDPLSDLVSLKQDSDFVECYLDKFEGALTRMSLPNQHALSIFLTNMNPHIALHVRQFNPTTISEAARIGRLHESSLQQTPLKQSRPPFTPFGKSYTPYNTSRPPPPTLTIPVPQKLVPITPLAKPAIDKTPRKYSYEEMQDRRHKGLCMFCEEPYTPGHYLKHKKTQIYVLDCEEDPEELTVEEGLLQPPLTTPAECQADNQFTISLNALNGSASFNCMRLLGHCGKRNLFILVDPGSTHNFLDITAAKHIGCTLTLVPPLHVTAANGNKMFSNYKCDNFS